MRRNLYQTTGGSKRIGDRGLSFSIAIFFKKLNQKYRKKFPVNNKIIDNLAVDIKYVINKLTEKIFSWIFTKPTPNDGDSKKSGIDHA